MAFRRTVKNVVHNFTDIEVKVRESTSNDPWGPSSSLMGEIADATYNVSAFSSIMSMLWKRLNDHGKNWRHVYKSLTVLDYIIKTGSERVAQQCRENLFAIQTLKDFQFIDKDGKDQGVNVREKSKQIVALLKDDERLKSERQRALKAKERFAQSQGGVGNRNFHKQNKRFTSPYPTDDTAKTTQDDSSIPSTTSWEVGRKTDLDSHSTDGRLNSDLEKARPTNEAEEEMQLQIALAMSREEAEQDEKVGTGDEKRLALALKHSSSPAVQPANSTLLDLTAPTPPPSTNTNQTMFDPWSHAGSVSSQSQFSMASSNDPWDSQQGSVHSSNSNNSMPTLLPPSDPWSANPPQSQLLSTSVPDPWGENPVSAPVSHDPWAQPIQSNAMQENPFVAQMNNPSTSNGFDPRATQPAAQLPLIPINPFGMSGLDNTLPQLGDSNSGDFLGTNSRLVDLNNIIGGTDSEEAVNPFATSIAPKTTNPFAVEKPKPKSINELRSVPSPFIPASSANVSSDVLLPSPLIPDGNSMQAPTNVNPFLL